MRLENKSNRINKLIPVHSCWFPFSVGVALNNLIFSFYWSSSNRNDKQESIVLKNFINWLRMCCEVHTCHRLVCMSFVALWVTCRCVYDVIFRPVRICAVHDCKRLPRKQLWFFDREAQVTSNNSDNIELNIVVDAFCFLFFVFSYFCSILAFENMWSERKDWCKLCCDCSSIWQFSNERLQICFCLELYCCCNCDIVVSSFQLAHTQVRPLIHCLVCLQWQRPLLASSPADFSSFLSLQDPVSHRAPFATTLILLFRRSSRCHRFVSFFFIVIIIAVTEISVSLIWASFARFAISNVFHYVSWDDKINLSAVGCAVRTRCQCRCA